MNVYWPRGLFAARGVAILTHTHVHHGICHCIRTLYMHMYGTLQECTNPCCNANTCQLAAGAECSAGTCCNLATCRFRPYGTTCRLSSGGCDISEFCQGDSQSCPVDTYRRDGTTCNNGNDYCFDGTCQTYNSQCQFHFSEFMFVGAEGGFTAVLQKYGLHKIM